MSIDSSGKLDTPNATTDSSDAHNRKLISGKREIPELWDVCTNGRLGTGYTNLKELDPAAWEFLFGVMDAGVAIWIGHPNPRYEPGSGEQEFWRPKRWPSITPRSHPRPDYDPCLRDFTKGDCLCANTNEKLAVVDVDPRNGGDIEKVRNLLANDLGMRIFAEVISPSGGRHFYVAGHPDLPSRQKIEGWPGVEIKSHKANITLPGSLRPKYGCAGYTIVLNNLQDMLSGDPNGPQTFCGDPEGAQALCEWVIENSPHKDFSLSNGQSGVFEGDLSNIKPYAVKVLNEECRILAAAPEGEREMQTNKSALKLGHYVGGGELPQEHVVDRLFAA
jgi:hypothetical protein